MASLKGRKQTPEHIAKRVAHIQGRKKTPEELAKRTATRAANGVGFRHGWVKTPTYRTWNSMHGRCYVTSDASYPRYGAKGVVVCERWHHFLNFLFDMGTRPEGMTLDRIDGTGNYEPGNCRWATKTEQTANRRPHTHTEICACFKCQPINRRKAG